MQCAYSKLFILLFMYLFAGGGRRFNLILHILYFYVPNILHLTLLAHFKYLFSNLILTVVRFIHKPLAGKHRAISLFIPHNNSTMGARGDSSKLFFYVSFLLKDFH